MINSNNYNYVEELDIDPDSLDVEWIAQPNLFMKYSEALAEAKYELDRLKEEFDILRADLDNGIRTNPMPYTGDIKKPTEAQIVSLILQQPQYQSHLAKITESKYNVEILSSAVRAFDQRKVALENLVRLHGQNYFSSPEVRSASLAEKYAESQKAQQIRTRISASLNRDGY